MPKQSVFRPHQPPRFRLASQPLLPLLFLDMTFDGSKLSVTPGTPLQEDRFRVVELETIFQQITCHSCDSAHIYKYKIKQLRRTTPEEVHKGGRLTPEQEEYWQSIPRYAEIPETVRCQDCGEVLGLYTNCVF